MPPFIRHLALITLAAPALAVASPAMAQDDTADAGPLNIEFTLAGVSDYRFRGLSLSNKHQAFQPSLTVTHESGLYASAWGSNIAHNEGDSIEVDLTAGWSGAVGPLDVNIGGVYYLYPGVTGINSYEALGSVGTDVGAGNIALDIAYTPRQKNTANKDNIYLAVSGGFPVFDTGVSLNGSFGIEDGAFADKKKDWSIGAEYELAGFTLGVKYVDTAHSGGNPLGRAGALFSVSKTF